MARDDEKAKRAKATKAKRLRDGAGIGTFNGQVHGPRIPGAEPRPTVDQPRPLAKKPKYRRPKGTGPPKDEVEAADRYTRGQVGAADPSRPSAHAEKVLRARELKRLIQPLTPSLIQVMSDIAHDKSIHAAVRLDAADRLITRLYGRPTEKIELTDPNEEADPDEVKTLLNRILDSVGAPLLEFHDDGEPQAPFQGYPDPPTRAEETADERGDE